MKIIALLALMLPSLVLAHIGVDAGIHNESAFVQGLLHPFTGIDHMAAMVAVGLWSVLVTRHVWVMPIAFAGLLLVGGLIGFTGIAVTAVEPMIATSLLVLGLLVAAKVRLPMLAASLLVGGFAIFHGVAHGAELPAAQAAAALSGMVLGTMALHLSGMGLGALLRKRSIWIVRVIGGSIAVFGTGLLVGVL